MLFKKFPKTLMSNHPPKISLYPRLMRGFKKCPYQALGVSKSASQYQIQQAFSSLSDRYHPKNGMENEEKYYEIVYAYNAVSSPEKREQHDLRASYREPKRNFWEGLFVDSDPTPPPFISGQPVRRNTSGMGPNPNLLNYDRLLYV